MEQKDYILREIQKIGAMIRAMRQKLFGGNDNFAITNQQDIAEAKGMLKEEINFDLDKFLALNKPGIVKYLKEFKGFNDENIEELADLLAKIGFIADDKRYLKKALELYDFVNQKSKTFSIKREENITKIKSVLE